MNYIWNNLSEEMLQKIADVRSELEMTEKGVPKQSKENCVIALEKDPLLSGAICRNELTGRKDIVKDLGWNRDSTTIEDEDISHILVYMEKYYGQTIEKNIEKALDVVVTNHPYHPIRDYLSSLEWDGVPRLENVLHHFLGAEVNDVNYECIKVAMLGAVHRVFCPGCKFELMLCLVGDQGVGKSTFLQFLSLKDEWFSDDLKRLDDENVYRKMQGHWIIEMSEMLGTANAKSVEEIKAFISRQKETYKTPYAKYPKDRLRQCVFFGTSNKICFLSMDRTGNRRFLPVRVNKDKAETHILDDEQMSRDYMDQLWAEIMVVYRSGEWSLKLPEDISRQLDLIRNDFMVEDTTSGVIQEWLDGCGEDYVCTEMIYNKALDGFGKPDRRMINEINDVMNNTIRGWAPGPSSHRFGPAYGTQRAWHRIEESNLPTDEGGFIRVEDLPEQIKIPFD